MATNSQSTDKFTALPLEMLKHIAAYLDLWNRLKLRTVFSKAQEDIVVDLIGDVLKTIHVSPNRVSLANFEALTKIGFFRTRIENVVYLPVVFCAKPNSDGPNKQVLCLEDFRKEHPSLSKFQAQRSYEMYQSLVREYSRVESDNLQTIESRETEDSIFKQLRKGVRRLPNLNSVSITMVAHTRSINASFATADESLRLHMHTKGPNGQTLNELMTAALGSFDKGQFMAFTFQILNVLPEVKALSRLAIGQGMEGQLFYDSRLLDSFDIRPMERSLANVTRLEISSQLDWTSESNGTEERWSILARNFKALQELVLYSQGDIYDEYDDWRAIDDGARAATSFLQHGKYPQLKKLRIEGSQYTGGVDVKLFEQFLFRHRHIVEEIELENILLVDRPQDDYDLEEDHAYDNLRAFLQETTWLKAVRKFEMKLFKHDSSSQHQHCLNRSKLPQLAAELNVPLKEDMWDFGEVVMWSKAKVD